MCLWQQMCDDRHKRGDGHAVGCYSAVKKNEVLIQVTMWTSSYSATKSKEPDTKGHTGDRLYFGAEGHTSGPGTGSDRMTW